MDWLYEKSPEPGGGKASSGGSSFHVSFRSGSRGMGSCAGASHDYITREGEYADGEPRWSATSKSIPSWPEATPDPAARAAAVTTIRIQGGNDAQRSRRVSCAT